MVGVTDVQTEVNVGLSAQVSRWAVGSEQGAGGKPGGEKVHLCNTSARLHQERRMKRMVRDKVQGDLLSEQDLTKSEVRRLRVTRLGRLKFGGQNGGRPKE